MKNQVLSIEQMQRLKELGVDIQPTGTCLMYTSDSSDNYYLKYGESTCEDDVAAFWLQDIIELLQGTKSFYFRKSCENFYLKIEKFSDTNYSISYENSDHFFVGFSSSCLLTCAYNMLIWVVENGYLKTKQNKVL